MFVFVDSLFAVANLVCSVFCVCLVLVLRCSSGVLCEHLAGRELAPRLYNFFLGQIN